MVDFSIIKSPEKEEKKQDERDFAMANYYDLDDNVSVDLSGLFDDENGGETDQKGPEHGQAGINGNTLIRREEKKAADVDQGDEDGIPEEEAPERAPVRVVKKNPTPRKLGSTFENSRRLADSIRKRELEREEETRGGRDMFGVYKADEEEERRNEAELLAEAEKKRDSDKERQKKKAEEEKKKAEERDEVWDMWLQKSSFYVAVTTLFITFIVLVICAVTTSMKASKVAVVGGITEVHKTVDSSSDGTEIYSILSGYRDFVAHDNNVKKAEDEKQAGPSKTPGADEPGPTATPYTATPEPAESTPEPTPGKPGEGTIVVSADEDFYVFDFSDKSYSTRHLRSGDFYTSGIGVDSIVDLVVSASGKDIEHGALRVQNPYSAEGFDLRSVLSSPLVIKRTEARSTPVILYYTHTSESYCTSEVERSLKDFASISGYDRSRSITGRGDILRTACQSAGTGVYLINEINDQQYDTAYDKSSLEVNTALTRASEAQLALDLHVNSFEFPSGMRYAPVATKDGKQYAKILFVVTQNDETNPNWKENIKLAMFIIEKLEAEVPGISLGISLRNSGKYNSTATKFGLLAELGFEGNLVREADASAELLGRVIGNIFAGRY